MFLNRQWFVSVMKALITGMLWNYFFAAVSSLRLARIVIPPYKFRGDNANLECDYELNGQRDPDDNSNFNYNDQNEQEEKLYSVKWYKDGEEIYRFVPKANPPQNSYKGEKSN